MDLLKSILSVLAPIGWTIGLIYLLFWVNSVQQRLDAWVGEPRRINQLVDAVYTLRERCDELEETCRKLQSEINYKDEPLKYN